MLPTNSEIGLPWRVTIVDDDPDILRSLGRIVGVHGYVVSRYSSAAAFLAELETVPADVLLVDYQMPGTDGLALQAKLLELGYRIPTVFLSGHGDVPISVRAIRSGALDFLEKPCDEETLIAAIGRAVDVARVARNKAVAMHELTERWHLLTRREREVYRWVVTGRLNKQIASALGTTEKTVKVHRARVMTKMQATSVAELVRFFDALGEVANHMVRTPARGVTPVRQPAEPPQGDR